MKNLFFCFVLAMLFMSPSFGQNKRTELSSRKSFIHKNFTGSMFVKATAYCPHEGSIGGGPITATGHRVRHGVIAVDPRVIPLYSKVYIPGYGEAIALDTGGNIKGNHIDLAFDSVSAMNRWGTRRVKIIILRRGRK